MTASDNLFNLVKSMTISEKGYFKKFTSQHVKGEMNNYIKLFDVLDECHIYDEKIIKEHFSGSTFVERFAYEKHYLYNLILKSLRNFNSAVFAEEAIYESIISANILHRKGLNPQALSFYAKAKEIAYDFDKRPIIIAILDLERGIINNQRQLPVSLKKLKEIDEEENKIITALQNLATYKKLYYDLYAFHLKYGYFRNEKEASVLQKSLKHPLLKTLPGSFGEEKYYYAIKHLYAHMISDGEKVYEYSKNIVEAHEKQFIRNSAYANLESQKNYIAALGNLLYSQVVIMRYKEALATSEKLTQLKFHPLIRRSEELLARIFSLNSVKIQVFIKMGELKQGAEMVEEITNGLNEYKDNIDSTRKLHLFYTLSCLFFLQQDYSEAKKWTSLIINHPKNEMREDLHSYALFLNLLILIEMENYEVLFVFSRSVYRQLLRKKKLFKIETVLLSFINKYILKCTSTDELAEGYVQTKNKLNNVVWDNPFEKSVFFNYFDFVSWFESKIENRSLAQIIKQKARVYEK